MGREWAGNGAEPGTIRACMQVRTARSALSSLLLERLREAKYA